MKRFIYTAALAAAMACPYGYAQTVDARADVPFNFRMGDAVMPAGKYGSTNPRACSRFERKLERRPRCT